MKIFLFYISKIKDFVLYLYSMLENGSFKGEYDPDLERIHNLFCFNSNFSKYIKGEDLLKQSPDYILEKYYHWIGFKPCIEGLLYTPDDLLTFMTRYFSKWGISIDPWYKNFNGTKNFTGIQFSVQDLQRALIYLKLTESRLNLMEMISIFERYIGPISMISPETKKGLHEVLYRDLVVPVIERNDTNITIVLRDMKLKQLIYE
jgi:hypothetical protein